MHKNELKLYLLVLAVVIAADFFFFVRYENAADEKENLLASKTKIQKFITDFQRANISYPKPKEKIFERKDLRQQIKIIARHSRVMDVQFKEDNREAAEVKFQTTNEKDAYDFLEKLYLGLGGIAQFTSIKIGRFSDNKIHAVCMIKTESPQVSKEDIEIHPIKYSCSQLNLFDIRQKHQLNCVVLGQKIFVDNKWFSLGDKIDEYQITKIGQSSVELKSDKKSVTIRLGQSW